MENTGEKNAPPPPSKPDTGKKKRRENRYDFIVEGRIRRSRGKKRINKNETGGEEEVEIAKCYMKKLIKKTFSSLRSLMPFSHEKHKFFWPIPTRSMNPSFVRPRGTPTQYVLFLRKSSSSSMSSPPSPSKPARKKEKKRKEREFFQIKSSSPLRSSPMPSNGSQALEKWGCTSSRDPCSNSDS